MIRPLLDTLGDLWRVKRKQKQKEKQTKKLHMKWKVYFSAEQSPGNKLRDSF